MLIGSFTGHSVSPMMHNTALQHHNIPAVYYPVSVKASEIPSLIAHFNNFNFLGGNITIPYKETLYDAVDALGVEAAQIGAINTIVKKGGKIVGENTDAHGFIAPIMDFQGELAGGRAIIFGTGGASKAIAFALNEMGMAEIIWVSRRPAQYGKQHSSIIMCDYNNWQAYADDAAILVNATPLGMIPNTDASPIDDADVDLMAHKICYDVVYNPRKTKFLQQAEHAGGIPISGLNMLIHQGAKAFGLWTGKEFPLELIKKKLSDVFPD